MHTPTGSPEACNPRGSSIATDQIIILQLNGTADGRTYHESTEAKMAPARRWSDGPPQQPVAAARMSWPVSSAAAAAIPQSNAGVLR
jgi:hypothetical protein